MDYKKLKKIFSDDPGVLSSLEKKQILEEVRSIPIPKDGEMGPQGEVGPEGPIGPQGMQGEKGEKGDRGEKGDKGDQGESGTDGKDGEKGADGVTTVQHEYVELEPKELVKKLGSLKGDDRLDYSAIKNGPSRYKKGSDGFDMSDQRWHGGGSSGGGGSVTNVTATAPLTSSGGTAPDISTSMSTNKLIGRSTAGTGVMEEISVGTGLSLSGGTLTNTVTDTGITQLTGDVDAGPGSGSQTATLATVNSNIGTFGDATNVGQFTVNGKGLITSASNVPINVSAATQRTFPFFIS